jgi:protein-serine/threonine kinase
MGSPVDSTPTPQCASPDSIPHYRDIPILSHENVDRQDSLTRDSLENGSSLPSFHFRQPSITPGISAPLDDNIHLFQRVSLDSGFPFQPSSLKATLSTTSLLSLHSLSPGSAISSPTLAALTDLTPLPSPLAREDSPGPWRRIPRPESTGSLRSVTEHSLVQHFSTSASGPSSRVPSVNRKKAYTGVDSASSSRSSQGRARSQSDYLPESTLNVRHRHPTYSGVKPEDLLEPNLHREQYLAEQRGLVHSKHQKTMSQPSATSPGLPTPPPSNRSVTESDTDDLSKPEEIFSDALVIQNKRNGNKTYYRPVRPLGQGTFSKVVLATSQSLPSSFVLNEHAESSLDPKYLVAIKIVSHGPAGGADEERVELSLKREVEIMQQVSHPSIIHLKAFDFHHDEALLVLGYCPGGDLFDLASQRRDVLNPTTVQRIFAELVGAVQYLHSLWIVHRDIKLESMCLPTNATADYINISQMY